MRSSILIFEQASTPREVKRRRNSFIPLSPHEFRQYQLEQDQKTTAHNSPNSPATTIQTRRKSIVVNLSSPKTTREEKKDRLSPVFKRLIDPNLYTGVYRRRTICEDGSLVHDGRINQSTDVSLTKSNYLGKSYTGSTNQNTNAKICNIKGKYKKRSSEQL